MFIFLVFTATTWIKSSDFNVMLMKAPIGIVVSLALTLFMWLLTLYKARRVFESSGMLKNEQTLTLSEDGIQMTIDSNDSLIRWNDVAKVTESRITSYNVCYTKLLRINADGARLCEPCTATRAVPFARRARVL